VLVVTKYTDVIAVAFVVLVVIVSFSLNHLLASIPVIQFNAVHNVVGVSQDDNAEYQFQSFLSIW
jgi:hypothetical protein